MNVKELYHMSVRVVFEAVTLQLEQSHLVTLNFEVYMGELGVREAITW